MTDDEAKQIKQDIEDHFSEVCDLMSRLCENGYDGNIEMEQYQLGGRAGSTILYSFRTEVFRRL